MSKNTRVFEHNSLRFVAIMAAMPQDFKLSARLSRPFLSKPSGPQAPASASLLPRDWKAPTPHLPPAARTSSQRPLAVQKFPEAILSGRPKEIGLAHGRRFSVEITNNIQFYNQYFNSLGISEQVALDIAGRFEAPIRQYTPELFSELQGIAEGSGIALNSILMLNARTEVLSIGELHGGDSDRPLPGCTSVAVSDGRSMALGQNWDWEQRAKDNPVMLVIQKNDGRKITTLSEAGMLAKIGCNSSRLGVCLNFLRHREEQQVHAPGLPVHVLLRLVLESSKLDEAVQRVSRAPRSASCNIMIAEHGATGPQSIDIEMTPTRFATLSPLGGVQTHANHFVDAALKDGGAYQRNRSSQDRFTRSQKLASAHVGQLKPMARLQTALLDRTMPTPISKAVGEDPDITLASVMMNLSAPQGPTMDIAVGAPHETSFYRLP